MPTPSERRALLFVATIAAFGAGWRSVRATGVAPATDAERRALDAQIAAVDSARMGSPGRAGGGRAGRGAGAKRAKGGGPVRSANTAAPVAGPERIDLDLASADELERLPRIGPTLARRIVADRDSLGPFGSLEAIQRVKGIGPAMARDLGPHVTFSGVTRSPPASPSGDRAPFRGQVIWRSRAPP
jgi:competence protein ComEA